MATFQNDESPYQKKKRQSTMLYRVIISSDPLFPVPLWFYFIFLIFSVN